MDNISDIERLIRVKINTSYQIDTSHREVVLILLSGSFKVGETTFSRSDVFTGEADGFCISNSGIVSIDPDGECEICIIKSACVSNKIIPLTRFDKKSFQTNLVGSGNYYRSVKSIIDSRSNLSNLIVGETTQDCGNWSSWPPHKHDTYIEDCESNHKEIYLYKFENKSGFGIQMVYKDLDNPDLILVRDNDTVNIDSGYHPVVSSPLSKMYYLWVLFGDNDFFKVNYES